MNKQKMWEEAFYVLVALGLLAWQPSATNALLALLIFMLAAYLRQKI